MTILCVMTAACSLSDFIGGDSWNLKGSDEDGIIFYLICTGRVFYNIW